MSSPYDTPTKKCPYCQSEMEADWCDVGVGMIQCGPYHCHACGASQVGPEENPVLDEDEKRTGFYKNKISPTANQINGIPINHKLADAIYRAKYFKDNGNPYNAPINR